MTDEWDPLAGRSSYLVEMLEFSTTVTSTSSIAYWEARRAEHRARGDGYGGWWCSKHVSAGLTEQRRRRS